MGVLYSPKIVTDGLVLYLDAANPKSYPGSGTTWNDLSSNENDGSLNNDVNFSSQNPESLSFLGNTPRVSSPLQYSLFSEFTLVTFFYNQGNSGSFGVVVGTSIGNHLSNGIRTIGSNITFSGYQESTLSIANFLNQWGCVAVTLDQNNFARCYYNGTLTNSGNYNRSIRSSPTNIGRGSSSYQGTFRSFEGLISTVSVYNRALTPEEIQQNYNATKSRFGL